MVAQPEVMTLFDGTSEDPVGFALCHLETSRTVSVERSLQAVSEAAKLVVRAQARFVDAVRTARDVGCSWRRIGTAAGVPYQSLHRRLQTRG